MHNSMTNPSMSEMIDYLDEWNQNEQLVMVDKVLCRMFTEIYPANDTVVDVLPKVVAIDRLYNTHLKSVYEMAKHIFSLNIDSMLTTGDQIIVDKIARCSFRGKEMICVSFASKYCSFSQPDKFVIYDSRVRKLLWYYKDELGIAHKKDISTYLNYKKAIDDLQTKFGLNGRYRGRPITYKLLDQYLWLLAFDRFQ